MIDRACRLICLSAIWIPLGVLFILLFQVVLQGSERIGLDFITSFPSRKPELAGIYPALVGSCMLISLSALVAVPIGVGAAIYLEEYASKTAWTRFVEINLSNLAGVPSVIYGLLGLEIFVRIFGLGYSLLAGALTLALLMLPIILTASREAIKTVPKHYQEASLALGSSKFVTILQIVIPLALPGILTGSILATSRAIGETAPLIVIGAATYIAFIPDGLDSEFTALPIQIFNWISRPQKAFSNDAAAGIIVLLIILFSLSAIAIFLRNRYEHR
ncbi:MAG: phosphate ABC transporter permease PstA [Deltaproteobacteria bacterium]|nr:phosphate ABC transporter permease PstA [Deltaproteobacteria bacterium]